MPINIQKIESSKRKSEMSQSLTNDKCFDVDEVDLLESLFSEKSEKMSISTLNLV